MRLGNAGHNLALLVLAACVVLLTGCGADERLADSPVAVVLHADNKGTRLTAVDLTAMEVVASRRLRSQCFSIAGDEADRVIVTAQTGGVGPDADDAVGIWKLAQDEVSYVTLPYPNPSSVAVASRVGYVMHGFQIGDSLVMSAVDLEHGNRVTTGTVSEWAQDPEELHQGMFLPVSASPIDAVTGYSTSEGSIQRLSSSMEASSVATIARRSMRLATDPSDESNLILVATTQGSESESSSWHISRIDKASGRIVEDRPLNIEYGVMSIAAVGGDLVLADANGLNLNDPGRSLLVLDGTTLAEKRRIALAGMPVAVAAWGNQLLAYDGIENELLLFGPNSQTPSRRIRLADRGLGTGDIEVFAAPARNGE